MSYNWRPMIRKQRSDPDRPPAGNVLIASLLGLLFLFPGTDACALQWLAGERLSAAREHYLAGDFKSAAAELSARLAAGDTLPAATYALVQALLGDGRLDEAFEIARQAVERLPKVAWNHAAVGDVALQTAEFQRAINAYHTALALDGTVARAHLGMARILGAQALWPAARQEYDTAYSLDPADPEVILGKSRVVTGERRRQLGREYARLATYRDEDIRRHLERIYAEDAPAALDTSTCEVAGPVQKMRVKLRMLRPSPRHLDRLGIPFSINGKKAEIALFDTGGSAVMVDERYAKKLGLEKLIETIHAGVGDEGFKSAYLARIDSLQIGEVTFRNCLVHVNPNRKTFKDPNDRVAVIGSDLFYDDFQVAIDSVAGMLELDPYPALPVGTGDVPPILGHERDLSKVEQGFVQSLFFDKDVLVPTWINDREPPVYLLLDSGAMQTILTHRTAGAVTKLTDAAFKVFGESGEVKDVRQAANLRLNIAGVNQTYGSLLTISADERARVLGYGVGGYVGWSLLQHVTVTIDARNALVKMEAGSRLK